jgi:hypothetical protein
MDAAAVKADRAKSNSFAQAGVPSSRVDDRAATTRQAQLRQMADASHQVRQLTAWQALADRRNATVAQLSPADWATSPDINRMLGHAHGWFSTWKKIKALMRTYRTLQVFDVDDRTDTLDEIKRLIVVWEADDKHQPASSEQRVQDILADLPTLRGIIAAEEVEIADDSALLAFPNVNRDIPDELTAGIADLASDALKAQRIFQNINNFRFRYTGQYIDATMAYTGHQGDCQTLVAMYQAVALDSGISFAAGSDKRRQLVAPRAIHGRNAIANTKGDTDWYFHEHYWAIGDGTPYDLLFMTAHLQPAVYSNGTVKYHGVDYHTFTDGRCVIEPGQDALRYAIQGEGRVFANATDARNFIDDPR